MVLRQDLIRQPMARPGDDVDGDVVLEIRLCKQTGFIQHLQCTQLRLSMCSAIWLRAVSLDA